MSRATDNITGPEICQEWWDARTLLDEAGLHGTSILDAVDMYIHYQEEEDPSVYPSAGLPADRPTATLEHTDTVLVCHDPKDCEGRRCTLHNRSDHPMRDFPQHWREDRGIIERICTHGVGHPDPDSPWSPTSPGWIHGCDGCCWNRENA